jgi:hypothetical protein
VRRGIKSGTDADLLEMFLEFNSRYFGGRLKVPLKLVFESINGLGQTYRFRVHGKRRSRNDLFGIRISTRLRWSRRMWMGTLLHEMVHLEQGLRYNCGWRGRRFNQRMRELALMGAFDGLW